MATSSFFLFAHMAIIGAWWFIGDVLYAKLKTFITRRGYVLVFFFWSQGLRREIHKASVPFLSRCISNALAGAVYGDDRGERAEEGGTDNDYLGWLPAEIKRTSRQIMESGFVR